MEAVLGLGRNQIDPVVRERDLRGHQHASLADAVAAADRLEEGNVGECRKLGLDLGKGRRDEPGMAMAVPIGDFVERAGKERSVQHGENALAVLGLVPEMGTAKRPKLGAPGAGDLGERTNAQAAEEQAGALRPLDDTDAAVGGPQSLFERCKVGLDQSICAQVGEREQARAIVDKAAHILQT